MLPETEHATPAQMRARIGRAVKAGDEREVAEARQLYAAAKLEAHVRDLVDRAPPLTDEQRDRLRTLLTPDRPSAQ